MKRWGVLLLLFIVSACERFPSNPADISGITPTVSIAYEGTEYVTAAPSVDGLVADKVNILTFSLKAENCTLSAIEFFGSVQLSGPPDSVDHAIHFRSDALLESAGSLTIPFEEIQRINEGMVYTFKRPVFPTNEYAPFENGQGSVRSVSISEIWAHDTAGVTYRLPLDE